MGPIVVAVAALLLLTPHAGALAQRDALVELAIAKDGHVVSAQVTLGGITMTQGAPAPDPTVAQQAADDAFANVALQIARVLAEGKTETDGSEARRAGTESQASSSSLTVHGQASGKDLAPAVDLVRRPFKGWYCYAADWPRPLDCNQSIDWPGSGDIYWAECSESDGRIAMHVLLNCHIRWLGRTFDSVADRVTNLNLDIEAGPPGTAPPLAATHMVDLGKARSDAMQAIEAGTLASPLRGAFLASQAERALVPDDVDLRYGVGGLDTDLLPTAMTDLAPAVTEGAKGRGRLVEEFESASHLLGTGAPQQPSTPSAWDEAAAAATTTFPGRNPPSTQATAQPQMLEAPSVPAISTALAVAGILSLLGVALYHRIRSDRLLVHPTRARILKAALEVPGLEMTALASRLEVHRTTLEHHVRLLAEHRVLTLVQGPRSLRIYAAGAGDASRHARAMDATGSAIAQRVVSELRATPGASLRALARSTGADRSTVRYHVERLLAAGVLTQASTAGSRSLRVAAEPLAVPSSHPTPIAEPRSGGHRTESG